jgi:single-strand DNA-binding protein
LHLCIVGDEGKSLVVNQVNQIKISNMSNLRNSVRLVGHLGNEPEVKVTANNKKLAKVSIATNSSYKNDKGEKVEETQWHNLVMWDKNAVLAEKYLRKGSEISIEGRLSSRSYTDNAGVKKFFTEIIVNEVLMLNKK